MSDLYRSFLKYKNRMEPARYLAPIVIILSTCLASCQPSEPSGIVAGSAHIESIVRELYKGPVTHTLIPGAMCPGHYDIRPDALTALAGCRAVIIHDWQTHMGNIEGALRAAQVSENKIHVIQIQENWMLPDIQAKAVGAVTEILRKIDPACADEVLRTSASRLKTIEDFAKLTRARLNEAEIAGTKVIANEMQAPLSRWIGLDVVATYGRPEELSVADMEQIVRSARETRAVLFIDNLQSGDVSIGETLARDADCVHVVLSNFPGGFDDTGTWEKALQRNIELLTQAIHESQASHG